MREEKNDMAAYSLHDIEQYLRGELPPTEMHAIEKAALQDPFLADAIEGYRTNGIGSAKQDLSSIHDQLPIGKQVSAKWEPSSVTRNTWWQAAAAIVLVAGATTLGWRLLKNDAPKQAFAQNKPVVVQQKADSFKPAVIIKPVQAAPSKRRTAPSMPIIPTMPATTQVPVTVNAEAPLEDRIIVGKKLTSEEIEKRTDSLILKPLNIRISDSLMGYVAGVEVKTIGKGYSIIFPPMITTRVSEVPKVDTEIFKINFTPLPKNGWTAFNRYISDELFLSQKDIISSTDSIVVRIRVDKTGTVLGADILHTFNSTWNSRVLKAIKTGPGWNVFSLGRPETFSITISRFQ